MTMTDAEQQLVLCEMCETLHAPEDTRKVRWGAFGFLRRMCIPCRDTYHRQQGALAELSPPPRHPDWDEE